MAAGPGRKKRRRRRCVVLAVIGEEGSKGRRRSDLVLKRIIKPAVASLGFRAYRLDEKPVPGEITEAILDELASAELVIADVTQLNPNVMYETGIRLAWNLPAILMAARGTKLAFDIRGLNTVFYRDPEHSAYCRKARDGIRKRVLLILQGCGRARAFEDNFALLAAPRCEARLVQTIREFSARVLDFLIQSLKDTHHEMNEESEPGSPDTLRDFRRLLRTEMSRFRNRWTAYEEMADAADATGVSETLRAALNRGEEIIDGWHKLDEWLRTRVSSAVNLNVAKRQLRAVIRAAQSIWRDVCGL